MKKSLAVLLALLLLTACGPALAGEITRASLALEDIPFEGEWCSFEGTNIQLYLPEDWVSYVEYAQDRADGEFIVGAPDATMFLSLLVFVNEITGDMQGAYDEMAEALAGNENIVHIDQIIINGIQAITYRVMSNGGFGAMVLERDAYVMMEFAADSEEGGLVFGGILASYTIDGEGVLP